MSPRADTAATIAAAIAAMGPGPLTEEGVARHVAPLFSRVLVPRDRPIYLANHSLGRALDATAADVAEAVGLWQSQLGNAWDAWLAEIAAYRARLAALMHAPRADCVVPKTSAGQGLRAILNSYDRPPRVVATRGEFDSIDVILRQYALRKRIELRFVEARGDGMFEAASLRAAIRGVDLVVLSQVLFNTGQVLPALPELIEAAHAGGARVLLDVYHSLGVLPVDIASLDVDFAIGGSYKYLRGGPGAGYMYLHPRHLDGGFSTLDIGWFAKKAPFDYVRPDPPEFAPGGDALMESTPPVLTCYQARAGQLFTAAVGVSRLREYSLAQQRMLIGLLGERGVRAEGGSADRGAFVVVRSGQARAWAGELERRGVIVDSRGELLRLCPDLLTTQAELAAAAERLGDVAAG
ncbi:MAG TPA: aminotransferase class V-fold PLP-dependent enzyme [Casimicrobiaceae bacterium]|nr:aminotransferase class V-fold PLP-dependent enzyme [Casimicrobiaceae bacterium]